MLRYSGFIVNIIPLDRRMPHNRYIIREYYHTMSRKTTFPTQEVILRTTLDSLDMNITNDLLSDPYLSSSDMARKYKRPLSTIQRRRTRLEKSILKKDYELDEKYTNWKNGEFFFSVGKGKTETVASEVFEKYTNNITLVTTTLNNVGNIIAHAYFKNSKEMFSIIEELKKIPYVETVLYAEHIAVLGQRKPRFMLEDLRK